MNVSGVIRSFGGRRFFITLTANMVNTALLVWGYIGATIYRDMFIGSVAAYIAGNVWQKKVESEYRLTEDDVTTYP